MSLPNGRGIRDVLNWHLDPALSYIDRNELTTDRQWLTGLGLLDSYGLSFDKQLNPDQLQQATAVAAFGTARSMFGSNFPVDSAPPELASLIERRVDLQHGNDGFAQLARGQSTASNIMVFPNGAISADGGGVIE